MATTVVQMAGFTGDVELDTNPFTGREFYRYRIHSDADRFRVDGAAADIQEAVQSIETLIRYVMAHPQSKQRKKDGACGTAQRCRVAHL